MSLHHHPHHRPGAHGNHGVHLHSHAHGARAHGTGHSHRSPEDVPSGHEHRSATQTSGLSIAAWITAGYAVVEVAGGLWSNSLALLSDAGHMITDSLALWVAVAAAWMARRPPSPRHSYGYGRVEVLAALVNAGFMAAMVAAIAWTALERLHAPLAVQGTAVTGVAAAGLAVNLAVAWALSRGQQNLNTRGALLHVMGDLLGSVAALASGLVIMTTGWMPIDPLLSLLICGLITVSTLRLAREALHVLVEGVPEGLSLTAVGERMARVPGVSAIHDLHIWALSSTSIAASAHVVLTDFRHWPALLDELRRVLHSEFGIDHATLQPELPEPRLYAIEEPSPAGDGDRAQASGDADGHNGAEHGAGRRPG